MNSAKQIEVKNVMGMESTLNGSALTIKTSGTFQVVPICQDQSSRTTDNIKLYIMAKKDGFDLEKMKKGKVAITLKPTREQKNIKVKMGKDKSTVIVTASRRVAKGTKLYCLIVYNTKEDNESSAYKVVEINVEK